MKRSRLFSVTLKDILISSIILILSSCLASLLPIIESGKLPNYAQVKTSLIIGLCAGLSFLIKNFITNSEGKYFKKDKKDTQKSK